MDVWNLCPIVDFSVSGAEPSVTRDVWNLCLIVDFGVSGAEPSITRSIQGSHTVSNVSGDTALGCGGDSAIYWRSRDAPLRSEA
jgi:hypothetical protein